MLVLLLLFDAAAVFVDFVAAFCVVVVAWPPFWSPPGKASPPLPQKFLYQFWIVFMSFVLQELQSWTAVPV